jgi:DNA-binding SARP family transcriptional activator
VDPPASASCVLAIDLLGGLRVAGPSGSEIRIPSRKAQALLACLALRLGALVARDRLATLLWEDVDPELGRASLRQALAVLRRSLPPEAVAALTADTTQVGLDAARVQCDVQRLRELMREGSPNALAQAADRYDAVLLPGFDPRSPAFEAWLDEQRRGLRREWLVALHRAAAQCRSAGDLAGAAAALSRLVTAEPANESAQRDLMDVYARQGLYTEALRQYRLCSEALRRDLDVAPEPATDALYRDIMRRRRGTPPAAGPFSDAPTEPDETTRQQGSHDAADSTLAAVTTLREVVVLVARIGRAGGARDDDPESLRDDWSRAERRMRETVERFGGLADRAGQGEIVAVFGLQSATGNEEERALRAARMLVESSAPEAGPPLAVGVARGLVLPATALHPFPVAGQPVTVARELAESAPLGGLRCAPDIARDGRDGIPPRALAGRRAELALLETLFERVIASSRGRAVVVRGEAGIGKSSLIEAFADVARTRATVTVASVLDFGQPIGDRPVPSIAAQLLDVAPGAEAGARRAGLQRAIDTGVLEHTDELMAADLLAIESTGPSASLVAAVDATTRERERSRILRQLLTRRAAAGPLLVIVEDAHWADASEIAQLSDLAVAVATQPVMLALSTRPEGDPFTATWRARARGCPVTLLDLAPLADDEARELAARHGVFPPEVLEHCLETAAGNPLFLVQLLRSAEAGQPTLPGSIRALLLARVERLPPAAQGLLHAAAILGNRFSLQALRHVAAAPVIGPADLEAPGLITCDDEDCRFTHALVREAVYESLLRSMRRSLHARAALWFETRDPSLYAEHLAAAEDPAAAAAHLAAATLEHRAGRFDRAQWHAERALALAGSDAERCEAHASLGEFCLARGRTDEAVRAFGTSATLAAEPGVRARARLGLATALRIQDRYDEALEVLEAAERDATDEGDARRLASVWTLRGNLYFPRGDMERCLQAHERALELAQTSGSVEDVARALGGLCDAEYQRGRMRTALGYVLRCLEISEQRGLVALRLAYLPMAAATRNFCGELAPAMELASQAAGAARGVGDPRSELIALSVKGSSHLYRAEFPEALACGERAASLARSLGTKRFESEAMVVIGLALHGAGQAARARDALEVAVERSRESTPTYCGAWALASLALACRDEARGRELLEEGEALLERGCVSHNHLEFRMQAAEFLLEARDWDGVVRHAEALAHYTRDEPLPWADVVIARARALAAARGGARRGHREELRDALAHVQGIGFAALEPRLLRAITKAG